MTFGNFAVSVLQALQLPPCHILALETLSIYCALRFAVLCVFNDSHPHLVSNNYPVKKGFLKCASP